MRRAGSDTDAGDELLAQARTGDPDAWRSLYEQIGGRLLVWLKSQPHLDSSLDHDDLANEAWFTAAAKIADFHGSLDDFAGWLFGIARNHTLNANRRTRRRNTTPTDVDPRELTGRDEADDSPPAADQLDWIRRVLAQLPQREAEVLACIDVVGLDVAATSQALSMSANAVRVTHHRAKKRLRAIVGPGARRSPDDPAEPMSVGSWR